jgi:glycosyltransferase involved in cell wall biosynthesis
MPHMGFDYHRREVSMKRPRVMHLVVGGDIGGAERLLVDLATRPDTSGADHEIAVITPNRALAALFVDAGILVHDRGAAREGPLSYLYRALGPTDVAWLARLLSERRADLLHTHTFGSQVLGTRAARRAGRPQLRTEHHVMHYEDASSSTFTRWAAARTDRFVAVSEHVKRVLSRTAPEVARRTRVVRNGVDATYFAPRAGPEPQAPLSAVIVCRLTAWKRVDRAILAAARADVQLVVVGDGELRRELEDLAQRKRAHVCFVGHQKDPRPFVAACDLSLNTSDAEPLGLSVLESLAMERPVIAHASGGIPEIVQHDVSGWLVEGTGARSLAAALIQAKAQKSRLPSMGAAGRAFVTTRASIDAMCRGYAAEYDAMWRPP